MDCKTALLTILDQVDYTNGACGLTEKVGAVLPKEVIALARKAIAEESAGGGKDPLKPSPQVLIALGSLIVHYEELISPGGHPYDKKAIDTLRNQPEVKQWFDEMASMAFLPVKR